MIDRGPIGIGSIGVNRDMIDRGPIGIGSIGVQ